MEAFRPALARVYHGECMTLKRILFHEVILLVAAAVILISTVRLTIDNIKTNTRWPPSQVVENDHIWQYFVRDRDAFVAWSSARGTGYKIDYYEVCVPPEHDLTGAGLVIESYGLPLRFFQCVFVETPPPSVWDAIYDQKNDTIAIEITDEAKWTTLFAKILIGKRHNTLVLSSVSIDYIALCICTLTIIFILNIVLVCGLRLFVVMRTSLQSKRGPRCLKCGYSLEGLVSGRCPECGAGVIVLE